MDMNRILAVYFSPTGTTKKVVEAIAQILADALQIPYESRDFTLPQSRVQPLEFEPGDLVILGTPVYAGRVPNLLLPYLKTIEGAGGYAVPVVLYGNRNYDNALIELRDVLERGNLHTIAAGAFIGEHSFSYTLAQNRPDADDLTCIHAFASRIAQEIPKLSQKNLESPVSVKGIPETYGGYYQPKDRNGNPIDIRKVKPLTNEDCNDCMHCVEICPMGAISHEKPRDINGICIKCGACIKGCPLQAKYYADEGYLYHKLDLEETFAARKEPQCFIDSSF